jgi:hypothetical protein
MSGPQANRKVLARPDAQAGCQDVEVPFGLREPADSIASYHHGAALAAAQPSDTAVVGRSVPGLHGAKAFCQVPGWSKAGTSRWRRPYFEYRRNVRQEVRILGR